MLHCGLRILLHLKRIRYSQTVNYLNVSPGHFIDRSRARWTLRGAPSGHPAWSRPPADSDNREQEVASLETLVLSLRHTSGMLVCAPRWSLSLRHAPRTGRRGSVCLCLVCWCALVPESATHTARPCTTLQLTHVQVYSSLLYKSTARPYTPKSTALADSLFPRIRTLDLGRPASRSQPPLEQCAGSGPWNASQPESARSLGVPLSVSSSASCGLGRDAARHGLAGACMVGWPS